MSSHPLRRLTRAKRHIKLCATKRSIVTKKNIEVVPGKWKIERLPDHGPPRLRTKASEDCKKSSVCYPVSLTSDHGGWCDFPSLMVSRSAPTSLAS